MTEEAELQNKPGETYSQSELALLRDVHHIDTRVSLLEQSSAYTAKALDQIRTEAQATNKTMREVRDSVVGWRSSIAMIALGISIVIPVILWLLDRLLDAAPGK